MFSIDVCIRYSGILRHSERTKLYSATEIISCGSVKLMVRLVFGFHINCICGLIDVPLFVEDIIRPCMACIRVFIIRGVINATHHSCERTV